MAENKNIELYEEFSAVPANAQKKISGGRLSGMTDINPMWRIRTLTEKFGPAGVGWKYVITDKRVIPGADGVVCAFVDIELYIKRNGEWSEPIVGTGGSAFVAKEKAGPYTNDECFKMALTDAISVACKALGMGADVYWNTGERKPETDDLKYHDVMAVQKRIQMLLTEKMQKKGMSSAEIAAAIGLSERKIGMILGGCDSLQKVEERLQKL